MIALSAAKLPVAGLRRQAATGVENIYPCFTAFIAGNCRLRRRWQQHPQVLWHCLEAAAAAAFASQSARFPQEIPLPFRVVSKCALTGGKEEAPGFPETSQRIQLCCGSFCIR